MTDSDTSHRPNCHFHQHTQQAFLGRLDVVERLQKLGYTDAATQLAADIAKRVGMEVQLEGAALVGRVDVLRRFLRGLPNVLRFHSPRVAEFWQQASGGDDEYRELCNVLAEVLAKRSDGELADGLGALISRLFQLSWEASVAAQAEPAKPAASTGPREQQGPTT